MSETVKIVLGAGLTLVVGIILLWLHKIVLTPYLDFRSLAREVGSTIKKCANVIVSLSSGDNDELLRKVQEELRDLAGRVESSLSDLNFRHVFSEAGLVPNKQQSTEASRLLIAISNRMGRNDSTGERHEDLRRILRILKLEINV